MAKGLVLNEEKKNYIALVLDKSGSMDLIKESIIKAFNDNIEVLKAETGDMTTKVCLVVFSTHGHQETVLWMEDLDKVVPLNKDTYVPEGMTAMYDAIGYTLERLTYDTRNESGDISFLVTVISDGHENDSKNFTVKQIADMVKDKEEDGRWTITYIGANQDLSQVSNNTGIDIGNTLNFDATTAGVRGMSAAYNAGVSNYFDSRRQGMTSVTQFYGGVSVESEDDE